MSPCLAAAGGALVTDVVRDVAARRGHLLDQVEGLLLELAALAGAALALRRQLEPGLARVVQPLHLALEVGDLLDQPLLRHARPLHLVHHRSLEVGQRVVPVLGGELAQQVLTGVAQRLRHQLLHLVLHGGVAVEAEVARDQLGELLRLGVEQLRHRAAVLAEEALELLHEPFLDRPRPIREGTLGLRGRMLQLVADRLDLGPGCLAVEHARADRERVGDRLLGGDVPLEAALDQLDQRTVRDRKPIDQHLVAARLDHSGAGDALLYRLKFADRSFHVEQHKVFLTPDGTKDRIDARPPPLLRRARGIHADRAVPGSVRRWRSGGPEPRRSRTPGRSRPASTGTRRRALSASVARSPVASPIPRPPRSRSSAPAAP